MTRRWLKLKNPTAFGLPSWVETVRPLSHAADNSVVWNAARDAEYAYFPGTGNRTHILRDKADLFRILRDGEFQDTDGGVPPKTQGVACAIGGDAFKVVELTDGRPEIATCRGSVWMSPEVELGSCVCIDRGVYGEFTEIGHGVKIDNLVHVGHSAIVGARSVIVAGTVLGGWCELGEDCWVGMGVSILPHVKVGAGSYVGAGTVVNRDVPPNSKVYGVPGRVMGGACCQRPLVFEGTIAGCPKCKAVYGLEGGEVVRVEG